MAKKAFVYDGSQWVDIAQSTTDLSSYQTKANTGLHLIKTQTITSSVASVTVTGAFSATYDAYLLVLSNIGANASMNLTLQMGTNNANYYWSETSGAAYSTPSGNVVFSNGNNTTSYTTGIIAASGVSSGGTINVINPFIATTTMMTSFGADVRTTGTGPRNASGYHNSNTSFSSFTINATGGSLTAGNISVYGYAK